MKKEIYIIIGLVVVLSVAMVSVAQAIPLSFVTVTAVDSSYGGRLSDYRISFQVGSSTEIQSQIRITFPAGFDVSRASSVAYGSTATSSVTAPSSTGSSIFASSTVSGQGIVAWLADGAVTPASDTIEITVSDIQNPYAGNTSVVVDVQTKTRAGGNIDGGSSTAFTIFASPPANLEVSVDKTSPSSLFTTPSAATTISAGSEYVIKGVSNDSGGSSVQKVEVSVDGGTTWALAVREGDYGSTGSYAWKYVWANPTAGEHTIKVRATDTKSNRETPSAGVAVTVVAPVVESTPSSSETPTTSVGGTTIQSLQLQVVSLQQQVVALLQQLLQLLTGQM
ncbi:MAG: hypothetical protein HYT49_00475 [Candidatus Wildermuthbacteria bacterium]|nr:hypothetical protein [Candidatus Wildermuthbacteria bacterium]